MNSKTLAGVSHPRGGKSMWLPTGGQQESTEGAATKTQSRKCCEQKVARGISGLCAPSSAVCTRKVCRPPSSSCPPSLCPAPLERQGEHSVGPCICGVRGKQNTGGPCICRGEGRAEYEGPLCLRDEGRAEHGAFCFNFVMDEN